MQNKYTYAKIIYMDVLACPKCQNQKVVKSGVIKDRQRYLCKKCNYYFTVNKLGKKIDDYYVTKALQLYLEGLSYRGFARYGEQLGQGVQNQKTVAWRLSSYLQDF